jgi:hypothetical protein
MRSIWSLVTVLGRVMRLTVRLNVAGGKTLGIAEGAADLVDLLLALTLQLDIVLCKLPNPVSRQLYRLSHDVPLWVGGHVCMV